MKLVFKIVKNTVFSILFLAIIFQSIVQLGYFYRDKDQNIDTITGYYEQDKNSLDAVFVGSSSMYRFYISPQAWKENGFTSFTYSSAAMPFEATPYVLQEVNRTQKPKVVVIDTRNFVKQTAILLKETQTEEEKAYLEKTNSFIVNVTNNMPYGITRAKLIHSFVPNNLNDQDEIDWQFDLGSNHNKWKDKSLKDYINYFKLLVKGEENLKEAEDELLKINCTRLKFKIRKQVRWEPNSDELNEKASIPKERLKIIDDLISYAKKENIKVLFLSTPYSTNIDYWKVENALAEYVKNKGFDYLNCNLHYDDIGIDFNTDYYDDRHTNALGAQKFTKYIGNYLVDKYNLKTSANKATKENFDKAYDEWVKYSTPKLQNIK